MDGLQLDISHRWTAVHLPFRTAAVLGHGTSFFGWHIIFFSAVVKFYIKTKLCAEKAERR